MTESDEHKTAESEPIDSAGAKPPYGGFRTFWNFVEQMHEFNSAGHFPQIIDRSVMGQRGGSSRAELYIALRFFQLIDDDKRPTTSFQTVVSNPDKQALRGLVERCY